MRFIVFTVVAAVVMIAGTLALVARPALAANEGATEGSEGMSRLLVAESSSWDSDDESSSNRTQRVQAAATGSQYTKECAACHMPYPPGLLPAKSWQKLMGQLGNHFGEDAELGKAEQRAITQYLVARAARYDAGANPPMRATKMRWFRVRHSEIPKRLVVDNPKVRSWSHCDACHIGAERGFFDEDAVRIP